MEVEAFIPGFRSPDQRRRCFYFYMAPDSAPEKAVLIGHSSESHSSEIEFAVRLLPAAAVVEARLLRAGGPRVPHLMAKFMLLCSSNRSEGVSNAMGPGT